MTFAIRRALTRTVTACLATAVLAVTATPAAADGMPQEPLARFEDPLCPGIIGLQVEFAVAVVARIRENAEALGIRTVDEDACEPNMIVAFLNDGQDYLQRLSEERGYMFESLDNTERRALLAQTGPARAWVTTVTRTRDGMQVGQRENLVDVPQAGMWSAHSRIYVPTRQDITASMVLIDRDATSDMSVRQLADYATLYGLADFVPEAASDVASIQNLFEGGSGDAPEELTEFDLAYLDRLYSSIPNLPAYARLEGLEGMAGLDD